MNKKLLFLICGCLLPMALLAGSGDVNGDGIVDIKDIKIIISHIMGKQPYYQTIKPFLGVILRPITP